MVQKEHQRITAELCQKTVKQLGALAVLAVRDELDFVHSYHHIHQIKLFAQNAITELDNLKRETGK